MAALRPDEQAVFEVARKIDSIEARELYLQQICGDDVAIGQRVRALLKAFEESASFLEVPAIGQPDVMSEPMAERPGTVIGSYNLMEQIGEGGMGLIFVAEQQHPVRRKVAIKVIKPGMDTREVIARFEAERQALALMDHPNIARVLDAGATESGRPYFVMELVRGVGITQFCDENRLTLRERLGLFVDICKAVQHAHQKGIIHRDLKATNILVTLHDGTPVVKVIDFGVAKAIGQQLTDKTIYTRFAQMIGTPMYMSPEQAEMSGLDIDTRSDIYGLGVLLYELLTGTTPFDKERLKTAPFDEIRRIVREEEPPRPSQQISTLLADSLTTVSAQRQTDPRHLSRLVYGELDWIVMKALEKDRNHRYETASAFAADVQRYLHDEPVQACPPTFGYRLRKIARRHRSAVLAVSLVLLALIVGIIGATWGMIRATRAEADALNEAKAKDKALTDKEAALAAAQRSERDANDQLFLALLNQARLGRVGRQMGQRLDSLAALQKAAAIKLDERLRDEAMAALARPDIRLGHPVAAADRARAFDDQYRSYATIVEPGAFSVRKVSDNEEIRCIKSKMKGAVSDIWLSPNGEFLAVRDEHGAMGLWRVADGKPVLGEARSCSCLAFTADSRRLAVAKDDWVSCIDLVSGQETTRWRLLAKAHALAFHPDNVRLAVGYADQKVASVYDSAQASHVADLPVGAMQLQVIAWHPGGACLAVAGSDPRIQIWDVAKKRKLATLEGHVEHVTVLTFHPEGGLLASSSWDGVFRLWEPATGRQLMQLPLSAVPRFSGNGQHLGYQWSGREPLQLLEVTPGREYRTIVSRLGAGQGTYYDGAISPDGRLLALGMGPAGDRLWDLASGRELAVLPSGGDCILFQPNSRELLTCGDAGLHRWPIEESKDAGRKLHLGPPSKITLPVVPHRAVRSPDGRLLAIISEASGSGVLMDLAAEAVQGQPFAHPKGSQIALSQDGKWIASSGHHSDRVRLWNAKTGNMVHEWVLGTMMMVSFTPDSRALIICRPEAFTFWDVDTLAPIRRWNREVPIFAGHVAYSPDDRLVAVEMAPGVIHLKEIATGRTVAKLEDPHGDRAGWLGFTPDGTQLVVAAPYAKAIHVWDLRAMRARLKGMGLDSDWPEFRTVP